MITDPTAPPDIQRRWDEARFLWEHERAKWEKHVLNVATKVPLVMTLSCLQPERLKQGHHSRKDNQLTAWKHLQSFVLLQRRTGRV